MVVVVGVGVQAGRAIQGHPSKALGCLLWCLVEGDVASVYRMRTNAYLDEPDHACSFSMTGLARRV